MLTVIGQPNVGDRILLTREWSGFKSGQELIVGENLSASVAQQLLADGYARPAERAVEHKVVKAGRLSNKAVV